MSSHSLMLSSAPYSAPTLEWGPAMHDPENPYGHPATEAALDRRDDAADLPDDN